MESISGDNVTFSEANWYRDDRLSNGIVNVPPSGTDGQLKTLTKANFKNRYAPFAGCIKLV